MLITLSAVCVAQQGLLGSIQYADFQNGQCPIAQANAGANRLAARHDHNFACTAGMGVNEFRIGDDSFITRHQDYLVAFRNKSCISAAPVNTSCENLHLYRRDRTPFLVYMEAFWRKTNGTVEDALSLRHQTPFSTYSEMDRNSRYVAKTMDFGPGENSNKMPLSKEIDGNVYYYYVHLVAHHVPGVSVTAFRRFDGPFSVQYKIDNEAALMETITGHEGTHFTRRQAGGENTAYGMYEPSAYKSISYDTDVLDGIVLALPLEIIMSDGLENVANSDVLACGAKNVDDDPDATFSPLVKDRLWVMPTKPCVSTSYNSVTLTTGLITALFCLAVAAAIIVLVGNRPLFATPSFKWLIVHAVLWLLLIIIFSTPSMFSEFGHSYGVFSKDVCAVPDDPPFEACNAAYTYRCRMSFSLAIVALLAAMAILIVDVVALLTSVDKNWGMVVYSASIVVVFSTSVITTHILSLVYNHPSQQADCGRYYTAEPQWGVWALATVTFLELCLVVLMVVSRSTKNGFFVWSPSII